MRSDLDGVCGGTSCISRVLFMAVYLSAIVLFSSSPAASDGRNTDAVRGWPTSHNATPSFHFLNVVSDGDVGYPFHV